MSSVSPGSHNATAKPPRVLHAVGLSDLFGSDCIVPQRAEVNCGDEVYDNIAALGFAAMV